MRLDVILRVTTKLLVPFMLVFALYVQFHGDYGPGGGFQAGVISAAMIILYGLMFGLDAAKKIVPMGLLQVLVPGGVLIFAGVGVVSMFNGGEFLNYSVLDHHDAAHGQHMGILLVEFGVLVTVASTMLALFYLFAGRGR